MALPGDNKVPGDLGHTSDHNLIIEEITFIQDAYLSSSVASNTYLPLTASSLFDPIGSASAAEFNSRAYTDSEISSLVDSAPATLDTLNELAAALGDDENFAATTAASIGQKLSIATASATYLSILDASSTYLREDSASATYLNQTDAFNTYFPRSASGGLLTEDEASGIYLRQDSASANIITYDNSDASLLSTNVKGALDELSLGKADVGSLSSNIIFYSTTASGIVGGYFNLVTSVEDSDYNTASVSVPTGVITGTSQLLSSLVSASNVIVGNPGVINITTIGSIAKTAGNNNDFAEFYFEIYKRDLGGTEYLIGLSDTTGTINPVELNEYSEFSANALLESTTFAPSDKIVLKYYANIIGGNDPEYSFLFGGIRPVRTLFPVPVSVIPISDASGIVVDTSLFNNNLSGSDTTVQAALETIDDIDLSIYAQLNSPNLTGIPTSPTASAGTNTTQIATTQFVATAVLDAQSGSVDLSAYLTQSAASATYLPISASATLSPIGYLTASAASYIYLRQDTASATYATSLSELDDVDISSVVAGEFLKYDGATWISASVAATGGGTEEVFYSADPPNTPAVGDIWVESDIDVSIQTYHAAYSSSSPSNPIVGDLWVDADETISVIPTNIDGGTPVSVYNSIPSLDAGGA